MSFIKNKEDFICEQCGGFNVGNGYTNHCIFCLYSKHVDIDPGDRLNHCGGLMRPIGVIYENRRKVIVHKCLKCGVEKKNKIGLNDSIDTMVYIQKNTT